MIAAMGLAAAACVIIGIVPAVLYAYLPYPVDYAPYTTRHVVSTLGLLAFTALGFFLLLAHLDPEPSISLDTDWFYRKGLAASLARAGAGLTRVERLGGRMYEAVMARPVLGAAALLRALDARVIDATAVGVGHVTEAVSERLRPTASGHTQHYALIMAAGVLVALALAVVWR
jgi:multicomponent Na+:H+ antiporter subunit D